MEKKYVAYYRVSTQRQCISGLGLDAQRKDVGTFLSIHGGKLVAEYQDIESGKKNDRPNLIRAIDDCEKQNAILLIAKLDRLSRNAPFILTLQDSKVNFVCCDMPDANSMTIGIMAILAQDERKRTSQRTRSALDIKKTNGVKLGNPRWEEALTHEVQKKGAMANRLKSINHPANKKAAAFALVLRKNGLTLQGIADELNKNEFRTPKGCPWIPSSVGRLLNRA